MKKSMVTRVFAVSAAATIVMTALAGCGGAGSSKGLDASLEFAQSKVKSYSSSESRLNSSFADAAFSKAAAVAMMVNADTTEEDFQKIARNLSVDAVTVTDEKGEVVACYPEGEKGKSIKETEDKKIFIKVVKGMSAKLMTDPVAVEGTDEYTVTSAVPSADSKGAVIVTFNTDEYNTVSGADLADRCGVNTIVLRKDNIISTTMKGVETGGSLDAIGVKDADIEKGEFTMSADGVSYQCKSAKNGDFIVICGVPA